LVEAAQFLDGDWQIDTPIAAHGCEQIDCEGKGHAANFLFLVLHEDAEHHAVVQLVNHGRGNFTSCQTLKSGCQLGDEAGLTVM
jgi:hypothetical protein